MPAPHHSVFCRLDALPADQERQSNEGHAVMPIKNENKKKLAKSTI